MDDNGRPGTQDASPPFPLPARGTLLPARLDLPVQPTRHADAEVGWRRPLHEPLRFVAAALLVIIAVTHALVTEDQFERATYLGVLFVLIEVGSLASAVLLTWRDGRAVWLLAGVTAEAAASVFLLARLARLPEVMDDVGRWSGPLALLALVLALTVCGLAARAVSRSRPSLAWAASRLPLVSGLVALQVGAVATFAAASLTGGAGAGERTSMVAGSADSYWSVVAGAAVPATGVTRTYYIGADEVVWDYAPTGKNGITGAAFDDTARTYVTPKADRIGSKYLKCLYRAYPNATFATPTPRPSSEAYLGIMGPVIHAAVGDTVKVVFRNACRFRTSVHPHGVFYQKDSEGAPYADGTSGANTADDGVPQGGTHVYTWRVPERAGPAGHDGSSVMWMYHSHTDEVGDTYAGLMGPIVVTAAADAKPDGSPKDVDRELFVLFSVMNENSSPYLKTNVQRFTKLSAPPGADEAFDESNLMHAINGYVFGNQPMMTVAKGQRVRWYVMGMGTEVDLHTPHWHGNDVVVGGMRMDVVSLLPASMVVADMVPDNPGVWLFHCHVNDHITAGMLTRYTVTP